MRLRSAVLAGQGAVTSAQAPRARDDPLGMTLIRPLLLNIAAVVAVGVVLGLLFGFTSQPTVIGVVVGLVAAVADVRRRAGAGQLEPR